MGGGSSSGGKSGCPATGRLLVRSPGSAEANVEVSLSKDPNPKLLVTCRLLPCTVDTAVCARMCV